jgi:hypothetical protein
MSTAIEPKKQMHRGRSKWRLVLPKMLWPGRYRFLYKVLLRLACSPFVIKVAIDCPLGWKSDDVPDPTQVCGDQLEIENDQQLVAQPAAPPLFLS